MFCHINSRKQRFWLLQWSYTLLHDSCIVFSHISHRNFANKYYKINCPCISQKIDKYKVISSLEITLWYVISDSIWPQRKTSTNKEWESLEDGRWSDQNLNWLILFLSVYWKCPLLEVLCIVSQVLINLFYLDVSTYLQTCF